MYLVSIELNTLKKSEWKLILEEREMLREHEPTGECFRNFFQFSQTFTSVFITAQKHGEHVFYFF